MKDELRRRIGLGQPAFAPRAAGFIFRLVILRSPHSAYRKRKVE